MNPLEIRLAEDRALRDAALEVFSTDLRFIRQDLRARSVGKRVTDRIGDSAMEIVDEAVDYAEANRGRIAAGRGRDRAVVRPCAAAERTVANIRA